MRNGHACKRDTCRFMLRVSGILPGLGARDYEFHTASVRAAQHIVVIESVRKVSVG